MKTRELQIAEKTSSNFKYCKKLTKYEGANNWATLKNPESMSPYGSSAQYTIAIYCSNQSSNATAYRKVFKVLNFWLYMSITKAKCGSKVAHNLFFKNAGDEKQHSSFTLLRT
jgi:hypothetical protein